jgi:AcrR family transcriptional regulator
VGHAIKAPTRRERQREQTYVEIVDAARELLTEGSELSLRAVAGRMGLTAPALYRYVASYQELVDLVAFEIDRAATERMARAAAPIPEDDPAGRLVVSAASFRRWAHEQPREFSLVFANPITDTSCARRELLTAATSGHYFHDLLIQLWEKDPFPHPDLADLDPQVALALEDPQIPIDIDKVPEGHRGILWVFLRAWAALYGVVTLEVFGHMDPRIIESGAMFTAMMRDWLPQLGLADEAERLEALAASELAG